MPNTQIINFDSLNGSTYNQSQQFNSYFFENSSLNLAYNSFNANFPLPIPLRNL